MCPNPCDVTWIGGLSFVKSVFQPGPELPSCLNCVEISCLLKCFQPSVVSSQWNCGVIEVLWDSNTEKI